MAQLCRDYWYPLYAFVRRRGGTVEEAQDVTQSFFLHAIDGELIQRARQEMGRFRSYLLTALQYHLSGERRRMQRQKRGGRAVVMSIDAMAAEERYRHEPADGRTPEALFERNWAFALLERTGARLGEDYARAGRTELFEKLRPYLAGKAGMPGYDALAAELGMNANAVGVAIHRMRRRYGELLRDEIAQTVATPQEVDSELAFLHEAVARG